MQPKIFLVTALCGIGQRGNVSCHVFCGIFGYRDFTRFLKGAVVNTGGCGTQFLCDFFLCLAVNGMTTRLSGFRIVTGHILTLPAAVFPLGNRAASGFTFFIFSCHK